MLVSAVGVQTFPLSPLRFLLFQLIRPSIKHSPTDLPRETPVKTDSYFCEALTGILLPNPMIQIIDENAVRRTAAERLLRQAGYLTQSFRSAPEFLTASFQISTAAERANSKDLKARLERLTPRETEVFTRVVFGQPNKQVAHELGTVEQTIKFHRANIMAKMKAVTFADLVRMAARLGIGGSAEFEVQSAE